MHSQQTIIYCLYAQLQPECIGNLDETTMVLNPTSYCEKFEVTQIYENKNQHARGHTKKRGEKWMSIKWGTYIQQAGTISRSHTMNLRSADKWSTPPPKDKKVISIVRQPARGAPYRLRFVMMGATDEDTGGDLLKEWLLPRIKERQLAVGRRLMLPDG